MSANFLNYLNLSQQISDIQSSIKENEPNLLTFIVFSVSGDSLSDTASSVGDNTLNPADKVSQWLWHPRNYAPSSGYDTMSISSSIQKWKES